MSGRRPRIPRPVDFDPLSRMRKVTPAERLVVMSKFLTALEAIARGQHPGVEEWRHLSDAVNTIETMAMHMGKLVPSEVMPTVEAATASMVEAALRHRAGKAMGLDGPGLAAIRAVVGIYEQCLDGFTANEMAQARTETQRQVNKAKHGGRGRCTVIQL